jgi:hypothetical protein
MERSADDGSIAQSGSQLPDQKVLSLDDRLWLGAFRWWRFDEWRKLAKS